MPMSLSKAKTFEIMEKESTSESDDDQNIPDIETISEYMSMRYDIPNLVVHIRISLIEGC
jgi:hypothetical protein